jgi:hypothetical protein
MQSNFRPNGPTFVCNVTATASSVTVTATSGLCNTWLITNAGATDCYFRLSTNPNVIANVPITAGTSTPGQMINAGDSYIIGLPVADGNGSNQYVANVTISANCAGFGTSTTLYAAAVQVM